MSNVIIPSISWPRRTNALTGEEDLLRQNPVGDSSGSPKEERIPVSLILSYVLSNLPASETEFTVTESTSDPAASGVTPASSFWNNTNSGEWFIIDTNGDSYSLGSGAAVDTLYSADGSISVPRTVTVTKDFSFDVQWAGDGNVDFVIGNPSGNPSFTIISTGPANGVMTFQNGTNIARMSGTAGITYLADYSAQFNDRSLVDKGYVDGIDLVDNGDGTYTFTDAPGNTTTINAGTSYTNYEVSDGDTTVGVRATGAGITISEDAANGILNVTIPEGVDVKRLSIENLPSSTNLGTYIINLLYQGVRDFNSPTGTAGKNDYLDAHLPLIRTGGNITNISEGGSGSTSQTTYGITDVGAIGGGTTNGLQITVNNFSLVLNGTQYCILNFLD